MDQAPDAPLQVGVWRVDPARDQISCNGQAVRVDARTMRLLLTLAGRAGQVVSIDELLDQVWPGVIVTQDSVYQAVASLRRLLGDDARQPAYIATVPRLGYRLVAAVSPWVEPAAAARAVADREGGRGAGSVALLTAVVLCIALIVLAMVGQAARDGRSVAQPDAARKSIAVLPFLDLTTEEMNKEYFADGMTEELIDRLSKVPGFRVPPPTASFYFKGRSMTVPDIARALGVTYVLDGSVRKSAAVLRIAARLVRADDDFVLWSGTYDRPPTDELAVQDEIAGDVVNALRASID